MDEIDPFGNLENDLTNIMGEMESGGLPGEGLSDDGVDVDELEQRIWRDRVRLKHLKERRRFKEQEAEA